MAAGVRTIAVRWLGDTKDLEKAGDRGEKSIGKWQGAFKKLDRVATGVLIGLGGAIAGAVGATVKAGDEIAKASRTAGVAAEPFQELRFAFGQAGVDAGAFDASVRRLNRRLGLAAEGGGPAIKAFESLDIAVHDANGQVRDTTDVLEEALPKLAAIESDAERAATASQLFGEDAGPGLAAALADGVEGIDAAREKAQELGIVMDQDALDASEEFSDAMDDLKKVGVGFVRDFALPFLKVFQEQILPVIQDKVIPAIRRMGEFIENNSGLVLAITGALLGLAVVIKTISVVIRVLTAIKMVWNAVMLANPIGLIILAIVALIAIGVLLVKHWDKVVEFLAGAWGTIKDTAVTVWESIKDFFVGLWDTITDFIGTAIDTIKNIFLKFHPLGIIIDNWGAIWGWVTGLWDRVVGFIAKIPNRIRSGLSNLKARLMAPFKAAFNAVAGLWNNTLGNISFTVPDWVPGGIGGRGWSFPNIPTMHGGGTVPGRVGEEVLILAQGGEEVRTPEQQQAGDGDTHVTVVIDGRAIDESMMRVSTRRDRRTRGRALAGAGALR